MWTFEAVSRISSICKNRLHSSSEVENGWNWYHHKPADSICGCLKWFRRLLSDWGLRRGFHGRVRFFPRNFERRFWVYPQDIIIVENPNGGEFRIESTDSVRLLILCRRMKRTPISSPQSSMRTGRADRTGKMSMIEPLLRIDLSLQLFRIFRSHIPPVWLQRFVRLIFVTAFDNKWALTELSRRNSWLYNSSMPATITEHCPLSTLARAEIRICRNL